MIRLYIGHALAEGEAVALSRDHAHYLFGVMRLVAGSELRVFDGKNGEFTARVAEVGKRGGLLDVGLQIRPLQAPPDLWLLFAPIKKARTDFIVEKAAELGAARILPVQTAHTNSERIRRDRLQAHVIEAVEQCGGTFVPEVGDLQPLVRVLSDWPQERKLMFCDETLADVSAPESSMEKGPWAILIGPEGGFSAEERERLRTLPQSHSVRLGPRILRADTAAVAALTLWQSQLGDWR